MKNIYKRVLDGWKALLTSALVALCLLWCLRFAALALNSRTLFGAVFRVAEIDTSTYGYLIKLIILFAMVILQRLYSRLPDAVKTPVFLYFIAGYFLLGLLNKQIVIGNYFYLAVVKQASLAALWDLIVVDMLFEPPFTFWGLCWLIGAFVFCRKTGNDRFAVLLWVVPLFMLKVIVTNLTLIFMIAALSTGMAGYFLFAGRHADRYFLFQGVLFAGTLVFLSGQSGFVDTAMVKATMPLLLPVWLAGYWLLRICRRDGGKAAQAVSWLVPFAFVVQVSQLSPLSYTHLWFITSHLVFAGSGIVLALFVAAVIAVSANILIRLPVRAVFNLCFVILLLLFTVDAVSLYVTGLRTSYHTALWAKSYLMSLFRTADAVVDKQLLVPLFLLPLLYFFTAAIARKASCERKAKIKSIFVFLVIVQLTATISYNNLKHVSRPMLEDPFRHFLASLPVPGFLQSPRPQLTELIEGFSQCGVELKSPSISEPGSGKKMNLVLVMMESVNTRYLSLFDYAEPTTPRLESLKSRMELFPQIFSNFPESSNADLSLMNGLVPPPFIYLLDNMDYRASTLVTALKQAGYSCFLFSSGFISDSGLAPFYLSQKYDKVFDPTGLPDLKNDDFWSWGVKKHVMVDKIVAFMEKHKAQNDGPFFLYYRTAFPHAPFQPVAPGYNVFDTSDRMRGSYVGSFKNCLLYLDEQFARLVSEIERIGLRENTIIAFIGDHGEMVGEEEYGRRVGHGTSLNPMLTNVPFIIVHPDEKSAGINHTPGSMPDIGATLLRLINCPPLPTVFSQGSDLRDPLRQPGPIYLSSLTQRAMIENGNYYQFPFPGTDDMRHFRIVASGGRAIFASQTESSADTLTTSYAKILKFMGLQSHLLTHIETYSKEFESRATASMSATLD